MMGRGRAETHHQPEDKGEENRRGGLAPTLRLEAVEAAVLLLLAAADGLHAFLEVRVRSLGRLALLPLLLDLL